VIPDSMLSGENAAFLDAKYRAWLDDPNSVDATFRGWFEQWDRPTNGVAREPAPLGRSIFHGGATGGPVQVDESAAKVAQLINTWRVRGHMVAEIDPLNRREKVFHPELGPEYYGLTAADLDREFPTSPMFAMPARAKLRDILSRLRVVYAGSIGAEFMNIQSLEQKLWVAERLEGLPDKEMLDRTEELRVLRKLSDAENFEQTLHRRFPGTKRFSLEGAETLIPLLDLTLEHAGRHGIVETVIGMAHRGRLNVLSNTLEKPFARIVAEFEDTKGSTQGSGDVKYHLGYSADVTTVLGHRMHLSLCFNPSHLEAVDPVVEGRVRAKQDRTGDVDHEHVLPILIHGDAAFAGQGLVAEVLNLSELHGYRTGGTLHVIVNNQIGFTTPPTDSRSTPYATDIARMLAIPIFHVNGEDPRAVAAAVRLAVAWRQTFHRDVVIDMYCYRKHGHNEGDEPSFTQPLMYDAIRTRPTPREAYAKFLITRGYLTDADVARILDESQRSFDAPTGAKTSTPLDLAAPKLWADHIGGQIDEETKTGVPKDQLIELLVRANTVPEAFHPHQKIVRLNQQRLEMARSERPMDWSVGEQAAFASLVAQGYRVRLSGQDSGRGTFSQRHAVLTDVITGAEIVPLQSVSEGQAPFHAIDSSLSEAGVLGFEFGYSLDAPDALVIWEAQFGDFVNGAQVIIDQFLAATETKWARLSGLVLMLPHGYEGQGPEHSSARVERFLQLCADDNLQVANCTTPSSLFHLLRRQCLRKVRKPLILLTPKSLLRHPLATSTLDDLAGGRFEPVIDDATVDPAEVRRVVLCSGKVYYELLAARQERQQRDVALVRVELLHPYPRAAIDALVARYPMAHLVWCQEEPQNMGAWPSYLQWFLDHLGAANLPRYVGRKASASPAAGSHKVHVREQTELVTHALTL
jgi:2-oxoglutarate dehydrogenase E1 component